MTQQEHDNNTRHSAKTSNPYRSTNFITAMVFCLNSNCFFRSVSIFILVEINVARFVRANSFRRSACVPVQHNNNNNNNSAKQHPHKPKQQPQDNIQHETIGRCKDRTTLGAA